MKKLMVFLAAAFLGSVCASAQLTFSAGWQTSQLIRTDVASDGYRSYLYTWSQGFYAGATSSYGLGIKGLGFDYSILYSYSTGTETDALKIFDDPHYEAAKNGQVITDEHYLAVPATLRYSLGICKGLGVYVYAGPEVLYCLSSKSYSTWQVIDGVNHWNVDHFGAGTDYIGYRRFDLGVLGGLGLEIADRIRIEGGADYGIMQKADADFLLHRLSLHAGIAYIFK